MSLRLRSGLANMFVLVSALLCAATVADCAQPQQFPAPFTQHNFSPQSEQPRSRQLSLNDMLILFNRIPRQGPIVAIVSILLALSAVSISLTRSILNQLRKIERIAKRFSEGDLAARIPPSQIPEIHQFEVTLNSVADRLQGVEKRRQEWVGDLAHEIGTPLTVIRGYLELLNASERFELTPEIKQQLHEEAERMTRLLGDLRVLSSLESEGLMLRLEPFHPLPVIQQVIASFHAQGWQNDCRLELINAENLPLVFADCDRVKQILINLISNAVEYTPTGVVKIRVWGDQDQLWIAVQDTGIGIAAEELPFVFQRAWRSKASQQLRGDGSGIGLAITKRLVSLMGGQIEVESTPGKGTTFKFCLPIDAPHQSSRSIPEATQTVDPP